MSTLWHFCKHMKKHLPLGDRFRTYNLSMGNDFYWSKKLAWHEHALDHSSKSTNDTSVWLSAYIFSTIINMNICPSVRPSKRTCLVSIASYCFSHCVRLSECISGLVKIVFVCLLVSVFRLFLFSFLEFKY